MIMNVFQTLLLLLLPVSVSSTALKVTGTPSCTGAFSLSSLSIDCGNECTFGRQVELTGLITSSGGFNSSVHVKSTACLMSIICITLVETEGDMCDNLEAGNGQECGAAGSYGFNTGFRLPGDDGSDWFHGYWIDVGASFTDEDGAKTSCKMTVKAVQSSYQLAFFASFCGIALLTGLSALGFKRKRAILVLGEEGGDEHNEPTSKFEMMKDPVSSGAMA